jgi:hypothetical protein
MKKKKNTFAKVMAGIALFAIILWIIWTGILVIVSSLWGWETEISQAELEQYIESLSGNLSATWSDL